MVAEESARISDVQVLRDLVSVMTDRWNRWDTRVVVMSCEPWGERGIRVNWNQGPSTIEPVWMRCEDDGTVSVFDGEDGGWGEDQEDSWGALLPDVPVGHATTRLRDVWAAIVFVSWVTATTTRRADDDFPGYLTVS